MRQRPGRSAAGVVRWRAQRSVMSAAWVVNGAIAIRRLRGGHRVALKVAIARTGTLQPTARFGARSEEHTSELQSLMRISYAVFCLKKKKTKIQVSHIQSRIQQQNRKT